MQAKKIKFLQPLNKYIYNYSNLYFTKQKYSLPKLKNLAHLSLEMYLIQTIWIILLSSNLEEGLGASIYQKANILPEAVTFQFIVEFDISIDGNAMEFDIQNNKYCFTITA